METKTEKNQGKEVWNLQEDVNTNESYSIFSNKDSKLDGMKICIAVCPTQGKARKQFRTLQDAKKCAQRIVEAVNSHDELIKQNKEMREILKIVTGDIGRHGKVSNTTLESINKALNNR